MRLSVEEMDVWAKNFYERIGEPFKKNVNWSKLGRDANWSAKKISVQHSRKEIDAAAIVNVARKFGVNPVAELSRIPRWSGLANAISKPTAREVLSSLHPGHIYGELENRLRSRTSRGIELEPWDSYSGRFSTWFDVTGGEAAKDRLARALPLTSQSALSARLNSRTTFDVDDILDGFIAAQMDVIFALVLAGYISDQEAGYSPTLREWTLLNVTNDELVYIMRKQMRFTLRLLAVDHSDDA